MVAPNPGKSLIAGQGAIVTLSGPGDYLVRSPVAMFAVLGETGSHLACGSRSAALVRLKEAFQDALDYAANRPAFDAGDRRPYALTRLDLEALLPVVEGELPLVVFVDRASDIESALRLAKDWKLKLILASVNEGWKVADQIAAAKVPVLLNPMDDLPASFETLGATLENAARLHRAGVTFAFMTGDAHNARNLKQEAGNAVAYGLPWEAALAAITAVPARIWGIADRYGTLEPGKDADVVIWDGDPLELTAFADAVFIRGQEVPMMSRQTELRDRYKNLGGAVPPAYKKPWRRARPLLSPCHISQGPQLLLLLRSEVRLAGGAAGNGLVAVGGHPSVLELAGQTLRLPRVLHSLRSARGPAPEGDLRRLAAQSGERQGGVELILKPAEDGRAGSVRGGLGVPPIPAKRAGKYSGSGLPKWLSQRSWRSPSTSEKRLTPLPR